MEFAQLLNELNIPYITEGHHHSRTGWLQLDCPFCAIGIQKFHLGYNLAYGYLNCWRCGRHNLIETLVEITGQSQRECRLLTKDLAHSKPITSIKHNGKLLIPKGVKPITQAHKTYLKKRGYFPKRIERLWNVQGIALATHLAWRLFIPIYFQGELVSWTTRAIGAATARYISAAPHEEALSHKSILYGEDYCRHAIIVHEGPLDAWKVGPGATATLGTGFSRAQVRKISKYPVRAICFDNEPIAQQRAHELCDLLSVFPGETMNIRLDAKDAGEAHPSEIKHLRHHILGK